MDKEFHDHEAAMARAELKKAAEYAIKLFKMIKEGDELEGWTAAKITKAADYLSSVYHHMDYEQAMKAKIDHGPRNFDESLQSEIKKSLKESWAEKRKG